MSLNIIEQILSNIAMNEELTIKEKKELFNDIHNNYGLVGSSAGNSLIKDTNECLALDLYYLDHEKEIEQFCINWFMKHKKSRKKEIIINEKRR